jgi:RNA polymerase sigma-70 factor (ECF subfamily)
MAQEKRDLDRLASFERHRSLLFSVAYRMLGSVSDAQDAVQETFIHFQGAADAKIENPRAYLVTIVTRLCLNYLQSARVRREQYFGTWLPEPLVTDDNNDPFGIVRVDESLSMALLLLLERLTPQERAVFILREVFEFSYAEIATALGQNEVHCRQLLHRAKEHVGALRQRFETNKEQHHALIERFSAAARNGDMEGLLAMLSADVQLVSDGGGKGNAVPNIVKGAEKVARGIVLGMGHFVPREVTYRPASINGEPGIVSYLDGEPFSAVIIEVRDSLIQTVFVMTNPDKLRHLR